MPITLSWSTYHIICKSNTFYLFNDVLHVEKSWHNCQYKKLPKTKCYNVVCKHHVQPSTNNMCIDCRKSADGAIERAPPAVVHTGWQRERGNRVTYGTPVKLPAANRTDMNSHIFRIFVLTPAQAKRMDREGAYRKTHRTNDN